MMLRTRWDSVLSSAQTAAWVVAQLVVSTIFISLAVLLIILLTVGMAE